MRKTIMAWSACAAAVLPALAATTASADGVPTQGVGQAATSTQTAQSGAASTQTAPSNQAINVAILSPGAATAGAVTQANSSNASSNAGNTNTTNQAAPQSGGVGGTQAGGQSAQNEQTAQSAGISKQTGASNQAIDVAILSPGAGAGAVTQSNSSNASSNAGNTSTTNQNAPQSGGGGGGGGVQGAGQSAENEQTAQSVANSTQDHPSNAAIDVSILSPGKGAGGGAVSQGNSSNARSNAGNTNTINQSAPQSGGGGAPAPTKQVCEVCPPTALPSVQGAGQLAENEQTAQSSATSTQTAPSNQAIRLSILSPGADAGGSAVAQGNHSNASSNAGNTNTINQNAPQSGGGWPGIKAIGQSAENEQKAWSAALSEQLCPSNLAAGPVGAASQGNSSNASSNAGNTNTLNQSAPQALWFPFSM